MRVPKDAEISVSLDHDRGAFGRMKGGEKGERETGGVTPGGAN